MRVVWSPHFDDAALSLGGAIATWRAAGERVVVVTVCAGVPVEIKETPLITQLQRGRKAREYVELRRREDQAAMKRLGAEQVLGDSLDAIYRLPAYGNEAALFGEPQRVDPLRAEIQRLAVKVPADAVWYLPMAVGNHVDHKLVCETASRPEVWFYEDLPYGLVADATAARIKQLGFTRRELLSARLEPKLDAVAAYQSQLETLFGGEAAMRQKMTAHAKALGEGMACEQVWGF